MKTIWNFLASIRLSVVLLLAIAAASITGTVIPQNESVQVYVAKFGAVGYRVLATLDVFDMYASWWFQALLLLLVVNIVVCSIDRLPVTLKAVSSKRLGRNPSMFRNLKGMETFDTAFSMDALREACRKLVSGSEGIQETPDGFFIIGEKGRWTRFGVYAVHMSIILLLVGALVGSMFGFDGYVNIAEGESVSAVRLGNSGAMQPLDFELRCDDFEVTYYPTGAPKEYRSSLTVLEQGQVVFQKDIIVNAPLRYRGVNIFQASYGQIAPEGAEMSFASSETGEKYLMNVPMGQAVDLPEGLGVFRLTGYQDSTNFRGSNVGAAFLGQLTGKDGKTETIVLPVRFPTLDQMRKGAVVISVSSWEPRYYTGLQVTRDPGVWVVYSGFILLIVGCFITFFTSHQRLFVEVVEKQGQCHVAVAGSANKNRLGMQQEVKRISEILGARKQIEDQKKGIERRGPTPDNERFFSFKGRIGRSTFWAFILPLSICDGGVFAAVVSSAEAGAIVIAALSIVIGVVLAWMSIAVYVKRWHDLDKSGWMTLTLLIPVVGIFVFLYLGSAPGKALPNSYGKPPEKSGTGFGASKP